MPLTTAVADRAATSGGGRPGGATVFGPEDPPVPGSGARLLAGPHTGRGPDLASHLAQHGAPPLPRRGDDGWPERLAAAVEASGLAGRGGAGFPAAAKLRRLRSAGRRPVLVVNAMEGEPASAKDRVLSTLVPHLVLDGAELAACALGSSRIVVCVAADHHESAAALVRAVAERAGTSLAPVTVDVARPPGGYVSGEESALVSWLGGGPAAPTFRPVRGVPLALGRRPALVHNAETLAHVALVARHGPAWFRSSGRADAPGTALVTVHGTVARPGVYEVVLGTPLQSVVGGAQPTESLGAVLTGGYGGAWVPAADLAAPYAPAPLAEIGGVLGAGVLVALPTLACGVTETARVAAYMAGESAGQCGPCVFGLPALARDLAELAAGHGGPGVVTRLGSRLAAVEGRGACRHPDGVVRLVRSALRVFAHDVAEHAAGHPCPHRSRPSVLPAPVPR